jgi:hypothetical protein
MFNCAAAFPYFSLYITPLKTLKDYGPKVSDPSDNF